MKTYRVTLTAHVVLTYEVEAENKTDAVAEAEGMAEAGESADEMVVLSYPKTPSVIVAKGD